MANTPQAKQALLMSFKSQLSADVSSMLVNFEEILKMACRDRNGQIQETTQYEIDALEMQVRAANVVRAADSLMKLVNDLKEYHILNDFPGIDEELKKNCELLQAKTVEYDEKIGKLAQDMADELVALEEEFYEYGSRNLD